VAGVEAGAGVAAGGVAQVEIVGVATGALVAGAVAGAVVVVEVVAGAVAVDVVAVVAEVVVVDVGGVRTRELVPRCLRGSGVAPYAPLPQSHRVLYGTMSRSGETSIAVSLTRRP
jgi:hypothetical protein